MKKPSFYKDLTKKVQKMFPNDYDRIREKADEMLREMCAGEKNKPKAITMHTVDRIFPCISIYKAIDEVNGQKEAAYEMISDYFEEISLKTTEGIQRICRFPLIYRLAPWVAGKIIKKQFGEKSGFKMKVHHAYGKKCHIDILKCPYHQYCKFYECEELTTAFCNADDVAYSNMHPNVSWDRTKTLGRGDKYCDFIIQIDR